METKMIPSVGTKLYLSSRSGNFYLDMVKRPYTVIKKVTDNQVLIQEAELIFYGDRYYDTVADEIRENKEGKIKTLKWSKSRKSWVVFNYPGDRYPEYATFGIWEHQPYLD